MIFKDKLQEISETISPEFRKLINYAWLNQTFYSDLLLLHINGSYEPEIEGWNKSSKTKLNPLVIGPGQEGQSEITHYEFIDKYRHAYLATIPYKEYLTNFDYSTGSESTFIKHQRIRSLEEIEETTIQLEMLVYLKFWEADSIIKKLYQLIRLVKGKDYDWYFKISESSRDKKSTGTRQEIIREKIRDNIKSYSESLYQILKDSYISQLRNAIAHSKYTFQGRNIHLHNYIESDAAAQLRSINFDDWIEIFHSTLILHNEYIDMNNFINNFYAKIAEENDYILTIRITEKDGKQYTLPVEYRSKWNDWNYVQ